MAKRIQMAISKADLERLAYRAKQLVEEMPQRTRGRSPDKADFLAAFEHELFGTDNKRGRRRANPRGTVADRKS